jgi:hypothetical protein
MNTELIKKRIDENQIELDKWKSHWKQIEDGSIPMLPPFAEMVTRHMAMYVNKIEELNWVKQLL